MTAVGEEPRRPLHDQLTKKLGVDAADTLMDCLPHAGWSDLARRSDLDPLEARLEKKIADGYAKQTRWFMGSQLVLVGAVIGSITSIAH
jgi:hypothetical protein